MADHVNDGALTGSVRIRTDDVAWRRAGDEVVVLDVARSSYHGLNASGALLWERLGEWTTVEDLASVLVDHFDLTDAVAAHDVDRFLHGCDDAGLLQHRPSAA